MNGSTTCAPQEEFKGDRFEARKFTPHELEYGIENISRKMIKAKITDAIGKPSNHPKNTFGGMISFGWGNSYVEKAPHQDDATGLFKQIEDLTEKIDRLENFFQIRFEDGEQTSKYVKIVPYVEKKPRKSKRKAKKSSK